MNTPRLNLGAQYGLNLIGLGTIKPDMKSGWLMGLIHRDGCYDFGASRMKPLVSFHFLDRVLYNLMHDCFGPGAFTIDKRPLAEANFGTLVAFAEGPLLLYLVAYKLRTVQPWTASAVDGYVGE